MAKTPFITTATPNAGNRMSETSSAKNRAYQSTEEDSQEAGE